MPVASPVPAPERPLDLDPEAIGAEDPQQRPSEPLGLGMAAAGDPAREGAVAGAAGEADQSARVALEVGLA